MKQGDLFNLDEGLRLKREGMESAAEHYETDLELGKSIARRICREWGTVHAEDVNTELAFYHNISSLGNAAGSLFKGKDWTFTGEWHQSTRSSSHGRFIRVWRLTNG